MIDALPASRLAFDWTFDPASALVIVTLSVLWLWLVRRHPRWPRVRSAAAVAAIVAAVIATQSGVATYDASSLTAHVIQHILLGMVVPVLAAASAPITLVLQAADPATRQVVRSALHHPMIRLLSRPLLGFAVFGGSIVVLMFSPLLDAAARNGAVHLLVHVHIVFAGALSTGARRPPAHRARRRSLPRLRRCRPPHGGGSDPRLLPLLGRPATSRRAALGRGRTAHRCRGRHRLHRLVPRRTASRTPR